MPRIITLLAFSILCRVNLLAQQAPAPDSLPHHEAQRTTKPPKIDGVLDDEAWVNVPVAGNFRQYSPVEGAAVTEPTEVKIVYDDLAVYVAAIMYDAHPDSIPRELGTRDPENINCDYFRVVFDPYNLRQDGYCFQVYASGVQSDFRFSDYTFNAVWQSEVSVNEEGWVAEIRIPYSAIRFPEKEVQEWALQFAREYHRKFEYDQWALVPRNAPNALYYFGTLTGIKNISPPTRLSISPYVSGYVKREPDGNNGYTNSFSYNYGADIKYGLDDRFTLDVTLLPDFGQVQSDNKVKNLGFQEVIFNENRTFFQEGVELFSLGNLFYTRRIGRVPRLYFAAEGMLNPGETLVANPSQARLLNATKLSGRTNNGLGIGVFNAVTADMNAVAEDSAGNRREILTEPLTNYNILVFDQQLKNNSNVYLINTSTMRAHQWDDANVTAAGTTLNTKLNKFSFDGNFTLSQKFYLLDSATGSNEVIPGYSYFLGVRKNGGNLNYGLSRSVVQRNYYPRDLGFFTVTDYVNSRGYLTVNKNKPSWIIRQAQANFLINHRYQQSTGKISNMQFNLDNWAFLDNYWTVFLGGELNPVAVYDYNEPRVPGMYFRQPQYWVFWAGFQTDERKKWNVNATFAAANFFKKNYPNFPTPIGFFPDLTLRYRFSNRFSVSGTLNYSYDPYNGGFAAFDSLGQPVLGGRKVVTIVQRLTLKYVFNPKLNFQLVARHYWSHGHYFDYFHLDDAGNLVRIDDYATSHDFNYNAFNIDAVLTWQFAPGSFLTVNYKNAIENEDAGFIQIPGYGENINRTIHAPQTNQFSVRAIYWFDVLYLRKFRKVKPVQ